MTAPGTEPLVVGLGRPDSGDDGIGPVVTRAVERLGLPGVRVVEHEDPTLLIDLWAEHDPVVVVDAVNSGGVPGTVHRLRVGAGEETLLPSGWQATGRGGTHAFGLGTAVELARALGRLPEHLLVVGVEAAGVEHGTGLSEPVRRAVDDALSAVLEEVGADVPR
jgi:hydrogenase maturation protease